MEKTPKSQTATRPRPSLKDKSLGNPWVRMTNRNLTELPDAVLENGNLEILDVSDNNLRYIPERLWKLPLLRTVYLIGNPIEMLPNHPFIAIDEAIFRRLRHQVIPHNITLILRNNADPEDLEFIADELRSSRGDKIQQLIIGNGIVTIGEQRPTPSSAINAFLKLLPNFTSLKSLAIRGLGFHSVPTGIGKLNQLDSLSLDGLKLQGLPKWLGEMNLSHLSAIDNEISTLPESSQHFNKLKSLHLGWNNFKEIPTQVFEMNTLETLDMTNCGLTTIPADILRLDRLTSLEFTADNIEWPPIEIAQKGLEAIRDYWRQRADEGVDYLCEAKLIILGEPGAGKTTLARKIEDPNYNLKEREKSTEGIDVIRYSFPFAFRAKEDEYEKLVQRDFQVNIWDFGGQEIYHATHQFFLTRRSVYVLVCDDRKEDTDFSYWLQVVEMLSDSSPLLIVQNEKQDRTRDINLSGLRSRYKSRLEAIGINLATNRGLENVIATIRKELEILPQIGVGLPATWKRVREALEQDHRDFITLDEYFAICQSHGFTRREDKLQLSGYLHDLGICLHFQNDPFLKSTVVLRPSWGTDAVYRLLDDPEVISARGYFTRKQLGRIWHEPNYSGMHDELLGLMMKFQLCYKLETHEAYIAPQLLSSKQPPYPWDQSGGLVIRYEYAFLPKGILTRLIVAMHRSIAFGNLVWKTGVILEREAARAEVIEDYSQRTIRVRVTGRGHQGLLAIIDEHMATLHRSFPRLQVELYLPCPCSECQKSSQPYGFALEKLTKRIQKGQQIQCHSSGEMINPMQLAVDVLPGAIYSTESTAGSSPTGNVQQIAAQSQISEVFVSYAWSKENEEIVDRIRKALTAQGILLHLDREDVRYKDSIREFMRRIGKGKAVIVIISEKYLKSDNCMFEITQIAKEQRLRERIFPVILPDANIYKPIGRASYIKYWENEMRSLDSAIKELQGDNLKELQEDLNNYAEIRRLFDGITGTLRDMNALTLKMHETTEFDDLIRRVRMKLED